MVIVSDYAAVGPVAFFEGTPLVTSWAIDVAGNFAPILRASYCTAVDFGTGIKCFTQNGIIQNTELATCAYQFKGMSVSPDMSVKEVF